MNRRPDSAIIGGGNVDRGGFAVVTSAPPRNRHETPSTRRTRPVSASGSMESVCSADVTGGTIKSDPGSRMYNATASSDVCFNEKVLKQISDNQTKFMQDRITQVERHFGDICDGFGGYARKFARLRDKGDAVAYALWIYASNEKLSPSTKESIERLVENFTIVQDYREITVRRFEEKVVRPLAAYGTSCKHAKERLRVACATRKRDLQQKSRTRDPSNSRGMTQTDLQKAGIDTLRTDNEVEREIGNFEQTKLRDIKQIVRDFVSIEMTFHAKALELLSQCYQNIDEMHEEDDLEFFRHRLLRQPPSQQRLPLQHAVSEAGGATPRSFRPYSLTSTTASDDSHEARPPRAVRPPQPARHQPHLVSNGVDVLSSRSNGNNWDEDEDEEEEDDDDDDDDNDDDDDDSEDDSRAAPI